MDSWRRLSHVHPADGPSRIHRQPFAANAEHLSARHPHLNERKRARSGRTAMVRKIISARALASMLAATAILALSLVTTASAQTPAPTNTVAFTATGNGTIKGSLV